MPTRLSCLLAALAVRTLLAADPEVGFNRDIRPILSEQCFSCHGFDAKHRKAKLRLDTREGALADHDGTRAIVPGDPAKSELWKRLTTKDPDDVMPPPDAHKPALTPAQLAKIRKWIEAGAPYEAHWAFRAPVKPALAVQGPAAVDALIARTLQQNGLTPSPEASPEKLLRRLSLDLTGLPPEPAELDAFLAARKKDPEAAYRAAVDRLLASPAYGERWGRWWLDQARYADSNGYSIDAPRTIWKYRDWVVGALNADQPFDRFSIEQLAGDLLPNATEAQRVATGFHRNTLLNQEGGIDVEQFRVDSVFDRVGTTGTVWLGLTVGCAQCHDHKFDPIAQNDYYRLAAAFWPGPVHNGRAKALGGPSAEQLGFDVLGWTDLGRDAPPLHALAKGDRHRPLAEVRAGGPSFLPALAGDFPPPPAEAGTTLRRSHLAAWITAPGNPLTPRVIVNRLWQHHFGAGLRPISWIRARPPGNHPPTRPSPVPSRNRCRPSSWPDRSSWPPARGSCRRRPRPLRR